MANQVSPSDAVGHGLIFLTGQRFARLTSFVILDFNLNLQII